MNASLADNYGFYLHDSENNCMKNFQQVFMSPTWCLIWSAEIVVYIIPLERDVWCRRESNKASERACGQCF